MDNKERLFALSAAIGPSGSEQGAAQTARELLRPFMDSVTLDVNGNVLGIRTAKRRGARCVLLDAHLDEVGMTVNGHDEGFLTFVDVGIDARVLPGLEVTVCTEPPIRGVVTCLPPHLLKSDEQDKAFSKDKLRIDCGLHEDEAPERVPIGTRVVFGTEPFLMGEKTVCGKSLDDRAGFAILIRAMELLKDQPLPVDVVVLGSTQEEFSGVGAKTGAYNMEPNEAIVVDVSFAKQPDVGEAESKPLGSGPMIGVGPVMNRRMYNKLIALAQEQSIPYTIEVMPGRTGTNADDIQITRDGVNVVCVSLPLRYMHTPIELIDLDDVENSAKLLAAYILAQGEEPACSKH